MAYKFNREDVQKFVTQKVLDMYCAECKWRKDRTAESLARYEKLKYGVKVACEIFNLNSGDFPLYLAQFDIADFLKMSSEKFFGTFEN